MYAWKMAPVLNCFAFVLLVVIHIGSGQKLGSLLASFNPVEGLNKHLTHHAFPIDNDVKEAVENLSPTFVFNQTFSEESLNFSSCVLSINKIKDDLLKHRSMHTLQCKQISNFTNIDFDLLRKNICTKLSVFLIVHRIFLGITHFIFQWWIHGLKWRVEYWKEILYGLVAIMNALELQRTIWPPNTALHILERKKQQYV